MTLEKALNISLPKWPQCIISGKFISEKQALEIIRRTDSFFDFPFGNNKQYVEQAIRATRVPQVEDFDTLEEFDTAIDKFNSKWRYIPLEYLSNSFISCTWVGGPRGWCHPDGRIAFRHNIGKWPTVKEVYEELEIIIKEFPFLDFTCTLTSGEEDEDDTFSLVSFRVSSEGVEVIDTIPIEEALSQVDDISASSKIKSHLLTFRENYFPISQLEEWAKEVFDK